MDAVDVAGVSKDQAKATRPGVKINVPLLIFELAETEVFVIGYVCVGGCWRRSHRLSVPE